MNKYRPGGRCGGPGASERPASQGGWGAGANELGKSLSAMMAAREQQDAMWSGGAGAGGPLAPQGRGQLVAQAQGQGQAQGVQTTRKNDMNTILQGDIGDD
jgi:hypothetical protein